MDDEFIITALRPGTGDAADDCGSCGSCDSCTALDANAGGASCCPPGSSCGDCSQVGGSDSSECCGSVFCPGPEACTSEVGV
jgi:hypothetical protein